MRDAQRRLGPKAYHKALSGVSKHVADLHRKQVIIGWPRSWQPPAEPEQCCLKSRDWLLHVMHFLSRGL